MLAYRLSRGFLRMLFRVLYRLEAEGLHHIPASGPVVLCSNHNSNWDPPLVGTPVERQVHFMAKEELFRFKPLGKLLLSYGAFPVKRGGVSKESIKLAIQMLRDGKLLCIFPEGTRGGGMGKKGAASIAFRGGATVVPAAIIGSYRPFTKMKIVYGEPVDLTQYGGDTSEGLELATEAIMAKIRAIAAKHG